MGCLQDKYYDPCWATHDLCIHNNYYYLDDSNYLYYGNIISKIMVDTTAEPGNTRSVFSLAVPTNGPV